MTLEDQAGDSAADAAPEYETVTIQWRDLEFTIPKDRNMWDMNVGFYFEDGLRLRAICTLLAGNASATAIHAVRSRIYQQAKTAGELDEFLDHVAEVSRKECVGRIP